MSEKNAFDECTGAVEECMGAVEEPTKAGAEITAPEAAPPASGVEATSSRTGPTRAENTV